MELMFSRQINYELQFLDIQTVKNQAYQEHSKNKYVMQKKSLSSYFKFIDKFILPRYVKKIKVCLTKHGIM